MVLGECKIMKFNERFDITKVIPAEYNPRSITDNSMDDLKESITRLGIIKPLIINTLDNKILAGHQRSKAILALGMEHAPVVELGRISLSDEAMFNQTHNSIETNASNSKVFNAEDMKFGYSFIGPDDYDFEENKAAGIVNDISTLIATHGGFCNVVIDEEGTPLLNSDYLVASKILNEDLLVYKLPNELIRDLRYFFSRDYGDFDYSNLPLKSYVQTYAQPKRLGKGLRNFASILYMKYVHRELTKDMRAIDFGAGRADHARFLDRKGYHVKFYEPFPKFSENHSINMKTVKYAINQVGLDLKAEGLYDMVINDNVLNSCIDEYYENAVMTVCNALGKKDATFLMATRSLLQLVNRDNAKTTTGRVRSVEFLDKNNYSCVFMNGTWVMQKFYEPINTANLMKKFFHEVDIVDTTGPSIVARCQYPKELPMKAYEQAIEDEFNIEYPGNYYHNQHGDLKTELLRRLEIRREEPDMYPE